MKLVLTDVNNGYNLFAINDNFEKIEQELQNKVLYRSNPVGEPNSMQNALDMNANKIINLPEPVAPTEPVRVQDVGRYIGINAGASFVQATPPTTAVAGNRWYDTNSGRTYIYYQDGDSGQWVEDNPQSGNDGGIRDDLSSPTGHTLVGFLGLQNFADDVAASVGGVPVGGLYRTGSIVKVRVV